MKLIQLIYISSATKWPTEEDLVELLNQARTKNAKLNVTGCLVYDNATYLQVLEGEEQNVHAIFQSISKDPRTTGIVKLMEREISQRDFPNWSMGFKNLEQFAPQDLPGYSEIFQGKLDKDIATQNSSKAVKLVLHFAKANM